MHLNPETTPKKRVYQHALTKNRDVACEWGGRVNEGGWEKVFEERDVTSSWPRLCLRSRTFLKDSSSLESPAAPEAARWTNQAYGLFHRSLVG